MTSTMFLSLLAFASMVWGGILILALYHFACAELRRHGHNPLEFDPEQNQSEEDQRWEVVSKSARLQ